MERERTLVRGQHVSSAAHLAVAPQTLAVGVRQCLASGQQYSVALHTVPDCGAEQPTGSQAAETFSEVGGD